MAASVTQLVKLDQKAVDAVNRLAKAIEHSNQLTIETARARKLPEPIKMPGEDDG